jgi:hypothetical protein
VAVEVELFPLALQEQITRLALGAVGYLLLLQAHLSQELGVEVEHHLAMGYHQEALVVAVMVVEQHLLVMQRAALLILVLAVVEALAVWQQFRQQLVVLV